MNFARAMWVRFETLHAVAYFGEETTEAGKAAGLHGFWMSYFAFRAAPMGRVGSGVVEATFFNFAPEFVARWVPEVWERADPETLLPRRAAAAAATLRRLVPTITETAAAVNEELARVVEHCGVGGRPLFAANRELPLPDDPVEVLWQLCTALREHRGDGHVAALTSAGVDGIEAHVLIASEQEHDPEDLQRTRGWTADDWAAAVDRCRARELVDSDGGLTAAGRALRSDVEATTDRLAEAPWDALSPRERDAVIAALDPAAASVARSGVIRYPNPIGLPRGSGA